MTDTRTELFGVFIKSIYTSEDSTYCVSIFRNAETDKPFTAVGPQLPDKKNLTFKLVGSWGINRKTGRKQFEVSYVENTRPSNKKEIIEYFVSLKCGVGRQKATRIYSVFGDTTWDIIDQNPEAIKTVPGITEKVHAKLMAAVAENAASRNILKLFTEAGVTVSGDAVHEFISTYGAANAVNELKGNPYVAYGIPGFTFDKCDALATTLGFPDDAPERLRAYVRKVLMDATFSGHVCLPKNIVLADMAAGTGVSEEKCKDAINAAYQAKEIRAANKCFYLPEQYDREEAICTNIKRLMDSGSTTFDNLDFAIDQYEDLTHFTLADSQRDAVKMVFGNTVSIITGGPGTGKTTVTKAVLWVHKKLFGEDSKPLLLAPTGKAARRMSEATAYPSSTIHSAVGWKGDDTDEASDMPLDGNLILVDESSMVDQHIAAILLERIESGSKVVFIGDIDQLPSVGCGNVLHDLIVSQVIPTTRLTVIFRQAGDNPIVTNAHRMNTGRTDMVETSSFRFIEAESDGEVFLQALKLYIRCVKAFGVDNVLLLNPQRNNTDLSVDNFNKKLQELLNPHVDGGAEITVGKTVYRKGDRVMELKNTDRARNGDIGIILDVCRRPDPDDPNEWQSYGVIEFNGDGNPLEYADADFKHVTHAWCTTVHKAQGAESDTVIQVISKSHPSMLKRRLVYTGCTRAKKNVAIIGQREAFAMAVKNDAQELRYTLLAQRLKTACRVNNVKQ